MLLATFAFINLCAAGLLAGEEFVMCYGIRRPLGRMAAAPQIELRQALIRVLRILVPIIAGVALLSGIGAALLSTGPMEALRLGGVAALVGFFAVALAGTVPINKAALAWRPLEPPAGWAAMVARWETLDIVRTWVALAAFALFVTAALAAPGLS
jgi:uncharacterized membrane protein